MKEMTVGDLMVSISEYATVSEGATMHQAALALEKAQDEFAHKRYSHRAVLILDKDKRVTGKLSQLDFLRALVRGDEQLEKIGDIGKFGFSPIAVMAHREKYRVKSASWDETITATTKLKVEDFMQAPSESEYIEENTSLDIAAHQLITGFHLSLLVRKGEDIVGVLRLSDIVSGAFRSMKGSKSKKKNKDK